MKQTAVEWLVNEMRAYDWWYLPESLKEDIIQQAKALEKEESFAFFKAGQESMEEGGRGFDQYYNITYKSK